MKKQNKQIKLLTAIQGVSLTGEKFKVPRGTRGRVLNENAKSISIEWEKDLGFDSFNKDLTLILHHDLIYTHTYVEIKIERI